MQISGTTQVTSCLPTPRSSLSILVSSKQLLPSTRDKTATFYARLSWRGSSSVEVVPDLESMSPGFTAKLNRTLSDIWASTGQPLNDTRRPDSSTSSPQNSSVQISASPQNDAHPTQPHVTLPRQPIRSRHTSTLRKAPSQPLPPRVDAYAPPPQSAPLSSSIYAVRHRQAPLRLQLHHHRGASCRLAGSVMTLSHEVEGLRRVAVGGREGLNGEGCGRRRCAKTTEISHFHDPQRMPVNVSESSYFSKCNHCCY
jgi:hypothetical protein